MCLSPVLFVIVIDCNMRSVVEAKSRNYLRLDEKIRSNFVDDVCLHSYTFNDMENKLTTKKRREGGKVGLKINKNKTKNDYSKRQVSLTAGKH